MIETMDRGLDPRRVGWKFARLGTLHGAGLNVPPFFCLTDRFFRHVIGPVSTVIEDIVAGIDFSNWQDIRAASERIRTLIQARPFDDTADKALTAGLDRTFRADAVVAVRASVIASRMSDGEDADGNPLAGMSDSFLYVPRAAVREAVLKCWASGFSAEGLLYRHRQGLSVAGLTVAVGVQQMVFGERSLVLFTCDPASYARDTVVSAGWGIGEGVVAEKADVDHYFLRTRTGNVERVVADKARMVTVHARGHGTQVVEVPQERRAVPVLSDDEVSALGATGRRIEQIFGAPQDIEATITADGAVHILQSRPVVIEYDRHQIWSSANVSESFPGTTTPMTYSVARRFYRLLNHDYLRRCGVPERRLHDLHETMTRLLGFIEGRVHHNITSFIEMLSVLPIFDGYRRDWERLVAELDTFYHHGVSRPAGVPARIGRRLALARGWARAAWNYARLRRDFAAFEAEWADVFEGTRRVDLDRQHPLVLVATYREVWRRAARIWGTTLINYQFMVLSHKFIEQCLSRWGIAGDSALLGRLLCGGRQLKGAQIALSAVGLAEMVRADDTLGDLFSSSKPRQIWQRIETGAVPAGFAAAVRTHLDRYGDRGLQELKLERPNLRDAPWELMKIVQHYVAGGLTAASLDHVEQSSRRAGEEELRAILRRHPVRRRVLLALVDRLRTFLYYREAGRYRRSELFGFSKRVIGALGRHLHGRGFLDGPEDVFLLDIEELFGFIDGSGSTHDLAGLVAVRRRDQHRFARLSPAREFATADIVGAGVPSAPGSTPERGAAEAGGPQYGAAEQGAAVDGVSMDGAPKRRVPDNGVSHGSSDGRAAADGTTDRGAPDHGAVQVLTGLGSCAGRVRGIARVVDDPALDGELEPDSILVARETDPGWLYLMLAARGIVVERGSVLSHTAITGRKFGIPTIVAVPDAMRRISDGSLIEIDGTSGEVRLLAPEAEVAQG